MSSFPRRRAAAASLLLVTSVTIGTLADPAEATPAPLQGQTQVPATLDDFFLPGTQPLELNVPLFESGNCSGCHGFYDPIVEPYEPWAASMMGQAGRDPIFYATLAIANQDVAFGGEACLRCHAPAAWLSGRSTPTDGSALDPALGDLDGVSCHFCHRMVDPIFDAVENPPEDQGILAGLTSPAITDPHTGSFVIDPEDRRRGPFDLGPNFFYHEWRESPFHRESLMCATCHDVSNPLLELQPDGSWQLGPLGAPHSTAQKTDTFPVERTYSEWAMSVYAQAEIDTNGRFGGDRPTVSSCQDCHMPDNLGTGANPGFMPPVRPDVPEHTFSGANSWVLRAIRAQYPDFETGLTAQSVDDAIARNVEMLRAAGEVEATVDAGQLRVRITNMMGHKLPTGYGEGRRMWIDVRFFDGAGTLIEQRGGYDLVTADLDTATTTVYEVLHGIDAQMSAATGLPVGPSLHFLLNNTTEKDNRIPARGFRNFEYDALGAYVVGTTYDDEQYWSDTLFDLPAGAVTAEVRAFHQTTSKEYIEFLRDENATDNRGVEAYRLWEAFGKSKPVEMGLATVDLSSPPELSPRPLALGKVQSTGTRSELSIVGSTSASGGGATLQVEGAIPGAFAVVFAAPAQVSNDQFDGRINVGPGAQRIALVNFDATGAAQIPVTYAASDVGETVVYQVLYRDVAGSFGLGMTNGLRVDVTQ
ncbi:MAG: hypothetical protein AAGB93_09625 [Planctomycetota bacterium]